MNKIFPFSFFLLTFPFFSFAQRVETYYASNGILKESYVVKDTISNIKNGDYSLYYLNGKIRQQGSYFSNNPSGLWEYYDESGKLIERYNFDFGNCAFYEEDNGPIINYLVAAGIDTAFMKKLDRLPHIIGGLPEYSSFLMKNLRYPAVAKENRIGGTVIASFLVEKDGTLKNPKIVKGIGAGCDDEVLRIIELMPRWVPALKEGLETAHVYYLPVSFSPPKLNSDSIPHGE